MIFIETPVFTRRLQELLDDDVYAEFQVKLAKHPHAGDLIEGTGGIRKIRVASQRAWQAWRLAGDLLPLRG